MYRKDMKWIYIYRRSIFTLHYSHSTIKELYLKKEERETKDEIKILKQMKNKSTSVLSCSGKNLKSETINCLLSY